MTKRKSPLTIPKMREKTQLCRNYPNCPFGDSCKYAHDASELVNPQEKYSSVYRSIPCAFFMKQGVCKFGTNCFFSHEMSIEPPPQNTPQARLKSREAKFPPIHPQRKSKSADLDQTQQAKPAETTISRGENFYGFQDVDITSGLEKCVQHQPNVWAAPLSSNTAPVSNNTWLINPLDLLALTPQRITCN